MGVCAQCHPFGPTSDHAKHTVLDRNVAFHGIAKLSDELIERAIIICDIALEPCGEIINHAGFFLAALHLKIPVAFEMIDSFSELLDNSQTPGNVIVTRNAMASISTEKCINSDVQCVLQQHCAGYSELVTHCAIEAAMLSAVSLQIDLLHMKLPEASVVQW